MIVNTCRWTLPYPIGANVNHQYRPTVHGGRRILSAEAKQYRLDVQCVLFVQQHIPPATGLLGLHLDLYPPDSRKRDTDGPLKITMDALADALGIDDYRIAHIEIWRHPPDRKCPRVEVKLGLVAIDGAE